MGKQEKAAPKAYQIRIAANALKNIDEITGFITFINHQPINAIKVGEAIFDTIARIEQNPLAFREFDKLPTKTKMYRRAVCFSWLIIYKVVGIDIIVLSVIHGSSKLSDIKALKKIK